MSKPTYSDNRQRVRNSVNAAPGCTSSQLAEATGLPYSTINRLTRALATDGQLVSVPGEFTPRGRGPNLWYPAPEDSSPDLAEPPAAAETSAASDALAAAPDQESTGEEPAGGDSGPPHDAPTAPVPSASEDPAGGGVSPARSSGPRRAKGQLRHEVQAYLHAHPGAELTAAELGRKINASAGAIANALDKLSASGEVRLTNETPRRFAAGPHDQ